MNHAIIDNSGHVINTVLWDGVSLWEPPADCIVVPIIDSNAGIGWTYVDGQFIPPIQE